MIYKDKMKANRAYRCFVRQYKSAQEAVADIPSGASIATGGFGYRGVPDSLLSALSQSPATRLALIACDPFGLEPLLVPGKVTHAALSYVLSSPFQQLMRDGQVELQLTPMGTLVEKLRAAGAGLPAFYVRTGVNSWVEHGKVPIRWQNGVPIAFSSPKETRTFNGKRYILEESLKPDYGFVRAWKADTLGNLIYRGVARNFNSAIAQSASVTIAEVDEIVPAGTISPSDIHTPCAYVHRLVLRRASLPTHNDPGKAAHSVSAQKLKIAKRAAREIQPGMYVNLGIGLPTLVAEFLEEGKCCFQSENGILGMGKLRAESRDEELVNAGREPVSLLPGAAHFGSAESFAMIRGGHIDLSILGAFEVSGNGDLANWCVPGLRMPGIGGGMDLVNSGSRILALCLHTSPASAPRLLQTCTLPLTGKAVVSKVITDLAVFSLDSTDDPQLEETAQGVTVSQVAASTGFRFQVSERFRANAY